MRTSTIFGFLLLASFAVPAFASAQGAGGIGSVCSNPSDCLSGNCAAQGPGEDRRCEAGTGVPGPSGSGITLTNPLKGVDCSSGNGSCVTTFLNNILDFVIKIGSIIVVLMIVFVGYKFVVAQGAPGKIEEARKMLLWTLVGALVLLGAKAISLGIMATVQALGG